MKTLYLVVALLCPLPAFAQVSAPTTVDTRDEGTSQGRARAINCVGAGISCTAAAGVATLTVGGGSVTASSVSIAMGGLTKVRVTVTDAAVLAGSKIVFNVRRPDVAQEDDEGFSYTVNVVKVSAGSFDLVVRVADPDADYQPPTETMQVIYVVG